MPQNQERFHSVVKPFIQPGQFILATHRYRLSDQVIAGPGSSIDV